MDIFLFFSPSELIGGVFAGLLATFIYLGSSWLYDGFRFKQLYNSFEGTYKAYDKYTYINNQQDNHKYDVKITRNRNLFIVSDNNNKEKLLKGEFYINKNLKYSAHGFYQNKKNEAINGFGIWHIHLNKNNSQIYADCHFSNDTQENKVNGYIFIPSS